MTLLYFIIFFVCCIFALTENYLKDRDKKIIYVILCGLLILLPATKSVIDTPDAENYETMFYGRNSKILQELTEPTFTQISSFLNRYGFSVSALFAVYALINIAVKGSLIYRMSPMPALTLCIYVSYLYILHDLIQIRAGAAVAFILFSIFLYCERKRIWAFVFIGVATLFHYSAIILFVIVFLDNKSLSTRGRWILASVVPIGLLLFLLRFDILSLIPSFMGGEKLEIYKDMSEEGKMDEISLVNPILWIKCSVYLLAIYFYDVIKERNKYLPIFLKLMGVSIFVYLIFAKMNAVIANRFSELFCIVEPFILTSLANVARPLWLSQLMIVVLNLMVAGWCVFVLEYILT